MSAAPGVPAGGGRASTAATRSLATQCRADDRYGVAVILVGDGQPRGMQDQQYLPFSQDGQVLCKDLPGAF